MVDCSPLHSPPTVFFDLETTGLDSSCEIVQLAAVSGGHTFNLFMVPRRPFQRGASRITGFSVKHQRLFLHRRPLLTSSLKEALLSFISFLRMLDHPLLLGHNIRRFDCPVLARALDEFSLRSHFQREVSGFVDTLPLARQLLKDHGLQSFKQESLVKNLLGVSYAAHNALEDVQALQKLYWKLKPSANQIQQHTFTLDSLANPPVNQVQVGASGESGLCERFRKVMDITEEKQED
ncbi:three prime repair exonuclease 4 isoform X1 [Danio rerio]|uniref:exodeoxyribonuclease III n=2 Tax=Danio rerio TaxID=7955 RepID=F1R5B7_DANRE|nr:three prime repair exonuclease 4 [Danio rerio]|eukprot:XP_002666829.1 maternal protein exuperantia-2-like [Danio rerio]